MINNLGSTMEIKMSIIMKYVTQYVNDNNVYHLDVYRIVCGPYMASLDMKRFSITLLKTNEILNVLDFKIEPVSFIPGNKVDIKTLINDGIILDDEKDNRDESKIDNHVIFCNNGANILSTLNFDCNIILNKINKNKLNFNSLYCTLKDIYMAGSSAVLYGYLFVCASSRIREECNGSNNINGLNVSKGLLKAVQDLCVHCGAKEGNRTMGLI